MKVFELEELPADAAEGFKHKEWKDRERPGRRMSIQVAPDDCTGCGVCVDVCPAKDKTELRHKAINMEPVAAHRDLEREHWDYFQSLPLLGRDVLPHDTIKGSQVLEPLLLHRESLPM